MYVVAKIHGGYFGTSVTGTRKSETFRSFDKKEHAKYYSSGVIDGKEEFSGDGLTSFVLTKGIFEEQKEKRQNFIREKFEEKFNMSLDDYFEQLD